jgi:hypothetical protein
MVPHTDSTNCSLHAGDKRQLYGSRRGPSGELFPYLHAQYNESCDFNDEVRWRWATVGPPCRLFASCVRLAVGMAVGVPVCSVLRVWICGGWRNHASWRADTRGVYQYLVCTALSSSVTGGRRSSVSGRRAVRTWPGRAPASTPVTSMEHGHLARPSPT